VNWLLDTNALLELTKPEPFAGLIDWLEIHEAQTAISAISIGEMIFGVERMPESKRRSALDRNLKFLREDYAGKILDFSEGVAVEWGRLVATAKKRGRNLSVIDSQIEATAIHFDLMVVTRNEKDFFYPVFNPWK
jgi:toxin FitB